MDYINGNRFTELADFVIGFNLPKIDFDLNRDAVIFCKTDFIDGLFRYIKNSESKYILITHMSDRPIDKSKFIKKPECVKKWFAENAVFNHPDLIPIPLGIENHEGIVKGKRTDHKWFEDNVERLRNKPKKPRIYCNWTSYKGRSNHSQGRIRREHVLDELKNNSDVKLKVEEGLSFRRYCKSMSDYLFVVCPPGYGIDTHRLWEALYLGCIPVVLKNRIYRAYNLPIIQVRNFSEVTFAYLKKSLEILEKANTTKLYMPYWRERIQKAFEEL